jgi:hypothetical protein
VLLFIKKGICCLAIGLRQLGVVYFFC